MKRRELLRGVGAAAGAAVLAGCAADGGDESDPGAAPAESDPTETPTATETPTETPTPTPTETPTPELVESRLARSDGRCTEGGERDGATVSFEDDAVGVVGAVGTPNPCYAATLGETTYDGQRDELLVTVGVTAESGACTQCLATVTYDARLSFEGGLPGTVTVRHERDGETETVTTVERS
jgi:hypothetical protein